MATLPAKVKGWVKVEEDISIYHTYDCPYMKNYGPSVYIILHRRKPTHRQGRVDKVCAYKFANVLAIFEYRTPNDIIFRKL